MDELNFVMELYESISFFRSVNVIRVVLDEKLLGILYDHGISMDVFELQAMFSDWDNSHVKIVWLNNFSAKYGIDFGRWICLALARTINDDRFVI
ncbi:MAG: hypothetical protein HDQ88_08910 [Clostridia bacterium]|nr:hypothetical protein [Clostridia bacterium]